MKRLVLKIIPALICGIMFWVASSCNKEDFSTFKNPDNFRLVIKTTNLGACLVFERVYTYDKTGNMIRESLYEINCELTRKTLLSYTEFEYLGNKKVKEKFFGGIAGSPTLSSYSLYFYEGDKLVREEYYSGFNEVLSLYDTRNYEYDKRGNLVRESWYGYYRGTTISDEGDLKYSYDKQNRLILKEETTAIDVNDIKYTKFTYDKSDRVIKVEHYNINWDLLRYEEKIYRGVSKLPEKELHFDKNGNPTARYEHFYDKWENLVKTVLDDTSVLLNRKYDGRLLIEEIHYQNSWGGCWETGLSKYEYERF